MYKELYYRRVVLRASTHVELQTVFTDDGVHGRVGNYYNTRVPVCFCPGLNLWYEEGMTEEQCGIIEDCPQGYYWDGRQYLRSGLASPTTLCEREQL